MLFKQIKHVGDNFSYIIADDESREAVVIDPSYNGDVILDFANKNKLNIKFIINTHHHSDHVMDNLRIKRRFNSKIVAHASSKINKDIEVVEGDIIKVGKINIKVIHTPGHTPDSICLLFGKKLFTGDTLFVGECGRTDLFGGNPAEMYNSLFGKLMKLDDDVEVYPGHDYGSKPKSTIGEEKKTNYVLEERSLEEFIEFMRKP
ncbi:MBL fold metallo-hydrolase [Candidatus Bathyarchaeota archaeon]|nr:MBL fold metallo-hydrolase [Candidatus Bathyarchaeota archaeon]